MSNEFEQRVAELSATLKPLCSEFDEIYYNVIEGCEHEIDAFVNDWLDGMADMWEEEEKNKVEDEFLIEDCVFNQCSFFFQKVGELNCIRILGYNFAFPGSAIKGQWDYDTEAEPLANDYAEIGRIWFDDNGNKIGFQKEGDVEDGFDLFGDYKVLDVDKIFSNTLGMWYYNSRYANVNDIAAEDYDAYSNMIKRHKLFDYCDDDTNLGELFSEQGEFFAKCGYSQLIKSGIFFERDYSINHFYRSIKVAHRHKYDFASDFATWLDLLSLLEKNKKDVLNPFYICPKDLKKAHDDALNEWNRRIEKERRKNELEALKKEYQKAMEYNDEYLRKMQKYLGIMLKNKLIVITPMQSAMDFIDEEKAMHHCVGGYYRNADTIIFSARNKADNKRIATIEYRISKKEIIQCRGVCNCVPQHIKMITNLIMKNVDYISNPSKVDSKRTKKTKTNLVAD